MIHGDRAVKGLMPLISTRAKEKEWANSYREAWL